MGIRRRTPGVAAHAFAWVGACVSTAALVACIAAAVLHFRAQSEIRNTPTQLTVNGERVNGTGEAVLAAGRGLLSGGAVDVDIVRPKPWQAGASRTCWIAAGGLALAGTLLGALAWLLGRRGWAVWIALGPLSLVFGLVSALANSPIAAIG
ncbi:MAG: hypothetical protein AAF995_06245 [Planctomycetota bacterium]